MDFTYDSYEKIIMNIKEAGYQLCFYDDYTNYNRPCVLRHDIDFSIDKAVDLAEFECGKKIASNYFVLLTSKMYNALSAENMKKIKRISLLGHRIGLHFDEARYPDGGVLENLLYEKSILENYTGFEIKVVSMHEPSREFIVSNMLIPGMLNTYSDEFFHNMSYCSDSMRKWRVNIDDFIKKSAEKRGMQVLTHPVWWSENEKTGHGALTDVQNSVNNELCQYITRYYPEHRGYVYKHIS